MPAGATESQSPGGSWSGNASFDVEALAEAVRAVDPEVFLVERRILRRVVRQDRAIGLFDWHGTHRKSYAIEGWRASAFLDADELGLPAGSPFPASLILLVRPEADEIRSHEPALVLRDYWRLLFHARVFAAVRRSQAAGKLETPALRRRIDEIGQAEFDEIRLVLAQDGYIADRQDLATAYCEFAALFLDLKFFAPEWLPVYFPVLGDPDRIEELLSNEIDARELLESCRLEGAMDPQAGASRAEGDDQAHGLTEVVATDSNEGGRWIARLRFRYLKERSIRESDRGNQVRAAICRVRAARFAGPSRQALAKAWAKRELGRMCRHLRGALNLPPSAGRAWTQALAPLLQRAGKGFWSPEARLLYDLQKIVLDAGREIYTVNLVDWALSLGRIPAKRPLPHHREVLLVHHLRTARRRLSRVRLTPGDRSRLSHLLESAVHQAEVDLRNRFRPILEETVEACDWPVQSVPEKVARAKLVEELLDRIVERGYVNFGELRDAVSRNQLKLDDLSGPMEFVKGDRLLVTDRAFARALDGVYRRGEIYLRWLQRFSSIAFGTPVGRLITRYALMPFGAAFVVLEGVAHLVNPVLRALDRPKVHLLSPWPFLILGIILAGLINDPPLRKLALSGLGQIGRLLRYTLLSLPLRLMNLTWVQRILQSRVISWLSRWGLKPLAFAMATTFVLPILGVSPQDSLALGVAAYAFSALLLNSRTGRDLEEILADRAVRGWQWFRTELIPGLFRLIMESFDRLLEAVERVLYTIDEWLRFKSGQGVAMLALKGIVGVVWFFVGYLIRVYVNLLIEPQVNPIKHFPVVTVSHKVLLPLFPILYRLFKAPLVPILGRWTTEALVAATLFLLPGFFGFLVWELKENWRLYKANRARNLRPVVVGQHGETVPRLLRPGFHSGTIPKLYRKLRRSGQKRRVPGRRPPSLKHREALHHVETELRRFVERDFLALLRFSRSVQDRQLQTGSIILGTNRILIDLVEPARPSASLRLIFEEQSGWLVTGIGERAWLETLDGPQKATVRDALAGLYTLASVDLVRAQIEWLLGSYARAYDISDAGLVVWPDVDYRREYIYDLKRSAPLLIGEAVPLGSGIAPALPGEAIVLSRLPLSWERWVATWEGDQAGRGHGHAVFEMVRLLPGPLRSEAAY